MCSNADGSDKVGFRLWFICVLALRDVIRWAYGLLVIIRIQEPSTIPTDQHRDVNGGLIKQLGIIPRICGSGFCDFRIRWHEPEEGLL